MVDVEQREIEPVEVAQEEKRVLAGRYRLDSKIAEGGFGVVYKATQLQLNRAVAVKIISTDLEEGGDEAKRRFMLEAATLAKLVHTNVVTIHDYGQTEDGDLFIVMEYLDGHPLDEVIEREGPLPFKRLVRIAVQIARALRQAHAAGVVHRDLKPANVMLVRGADESDWDHVKVLDFGLVKLMEHSTGKPLERTQATSLLGTPKYMSPEQICGEETDGRADMYSFGCILYHLVTGAPPFPGETKFEVVQAHLTHAVPPLTESGYQRACPRQLEAVIKKCLEKVPAHRYSSMGEVIEGLKGAYGRLPVEGGVRVDFNDDSNDLSDSSLSIEANRSDISDSGIQVRRMVSTAGPSFPSAITAPEAPQKEEPKKLGAIVAAAAVGAALTGVLVYAVAAREPAVVTPLLPPAPAVAAAAATESRVTFKSKPAGAKVSESGVVFGLTPFILAFPIEPSSVRKFRFEQKGRQPIEVQVRLDQPQVEIEVELDEAETNAPAAPDRAPRSAPKVTKSAPPPPPPAVVSEKEPAPEPVALVAPPAVTPKTPPVMVEPPKEEPKPVAPPAPPAPEPVVEKKPEQKPAPASLAARAPVIVAAKRKGKMKEPVYPSEYRGQDVEGQVVARIFVDEKGEVSKVEIVSSSGHRAFDAAVVKAAKKDRYEPATRDGLPVADSFDVKYGFRLTDR